MVGKIEKNIPEDDPRNPGVIADLVGDNVGDDAGMAADLFETYVITAVAAMILGELTFKGNQIVLYYPLLIGAISIIASIVGSWFVKVKGTGIMTALYKGLGITMVISIIGIYYVTNTTFYRSLDGGINWSSNKLPTSRAGVKLLIDSKNPSIIYLAVRQIKK